MMDGDATKQSEVEHVKAALIAELGDQYGCSSERCCCSGAEEVFECKMNVSADALALAVIAAVHNFEASKRTTNGGTSS